MTYYIRHFEEHTDGSTPTIWIIGFNDETKKFSVFLPADTNGDGDNSTYECEQIDVPHIKVEDGKKVYEDTDGMILRCGKCKEWGHGKDDCEAIHRAVAKIKRQ